MGCSKKHTCAEFDPIYQNRSDAVSNSESSGFGLVAATTNGGPGFATTIPALQMYKVAFGDGKFGRASAMGVILFVVIIILTLLSRKTMKEED